ncbi:MAG: PorP/SprF family type IX secretion system membrane protein [Bacteroidota bacterium]
MNARAVSFLLVLMSLLLSAQAQEEPLFAQYRTNAFLINPAVAGTYESHQIRLNHRAQWMNFPGAPRTTVMSYQGFVDNKNSVGFTAFRDAIGPNVRTGIQGAYAFRMPVGYSGTMGQNYLSLGMSAKLMQYRFQTQSTFLQDRSDVLAWEAYRGLVYGDVAFGAYFYNDNMYVGMSAPNLIRSDLAVPSGSASPEIVSRLYRYYFAFAGYYFRYDNMTIEPSILFKKIANSPYQIEGTVRFHLVEERFIVGLSYRTDWTGTLMVGVKAAPLSFYYSHDLMPVSQRDLNFGASHEFTLGFDLGEKGNWSKYFKEK